MISIDFSIAYRQAGELAQCAEELFHQCNKLEKTIADVRSAWSGETSAAYAKKLEAFRVQLQKDAAQCRDEAISFRSKINELKKMEAEMALALSALSEGAR